MYFLKGVSQLFSWQIEKWFELQGASQQLPWVVSVSMGNERVITRYVSRVNGCNLIGRLVPLAAFFEPIL